MKNVIISLIIFALTIGVAGCEVPVTNNVTTQAPSQAPASPSQSVAGKNASTPVPVQPTVIPADCAQTTFGTYGYKVIRDAVSVVIGPDCRIRVGGNGFSLTQLLSNGSSDLSFGSGGTLNTSVLASSTLNSISLQSNGNIIAAGWNAIAQYMPNGDLDKDFGTGGIEIQNYSTSTYYGLKLDYNGEALYGQAMNPSDMIYSSGKIGIAAVFGGYDNDYGQAFLLRSTKTYIPTMPRIDAFAVQQDGKIVVVGGAYVMRLNYDYTVDRTFAAGGNPVGTFSTYSITGASGAQLTGVAIQADGKIVLAGNFTSVPAYNHGQVIRLTPNGLLDK